MNGTTGMKVKQAKNPGEGEFFRGPIKEEMGTEERIISGGKGIYQEWKENLANGREAAEENEGQRRFKDESTKGMGTEEEGNGREERRHSHPQTEISSVEGRRTLKMGESIANDTVWLLGSKTLSNQSDSRL